jgi:hypothetical protein
MSVNKLTNKLIAEKWHGDEPIYKKTISVKNDVEFGRLLNWYNFMAEDKHKDKWLTDYMKLSGYSKNDINHIMNLEALGAVCKNSAAILARIESNGTSFSGELTNIVRNKINYALSFNQKKVSVDVETEKVVSIQDRVKALAEPHIITIDDEIHTWYHERKTKIDFSLYSYLQRNQLNAQICNHISALIVKIHDEHAEMLEGTDEQLNEAYSYLPNASKKAIMKNLIACMEDIKRFIGNTKASKPKKSRKKKEVTASKLINKVKYQREFNKLKIKSIMPESIVGCQQLWLYNTKYNHLSVYNSIDANGLSVKGTTLVNYDTTSSMKKTIRKPEEVIQTVLNGAKGYLKKLLLDIKTKPIEVNGRINEDTIILKAIK